MHGHIGESDPYGDFALMQEPASSSIYISCMDLRVSVGNAMLLYATRVHCVHA